MADLKRAIEIAYDAHDGQFRRNGKEYITHPIAVMEAAEKLGFSVARLTVAVLHDTPEENEAWPVERIEEEGFGPDVTVPLRLLTKVDGEEYTLYIERLSEDPDARAIKILDMEHNLHDDPSQRQVTKYTWALAYLATKNAA